MTPSRGCYSFPLLRAHLPVLLSSTCQSLFTYKPSANQVGIASSINHVLKKETLSRYTIKCIFNF